MGALRWIVAAEHAWDAARSRRTARRPPAHFRIQSYDGHGTSAGVVVRGRVVDDPPLTSAVEGEGVRAALRRQVRGFLTDELPGVPLRVSVAGAHADVVSDAEGYFRVLLQPTVPLEAPVTTGTIELAGEYRGITGSHTTDVHVHVPSPRAELGIVSDIDDTVLETGVQRVGRMVVQTFTGSALTRTPFPGVVELYRDLTGDGVNPVFYVSSSPWNLHAFIDGFLRHRRFPLGPVLLRDLLGTAAGREEKHDRIREVLDLHPGLRFVLIGDSGEKDPEIYADIVREHPGRIIAVYIREVRLDPGDGRVERVADAWDHDVPFVLAADSDAVRRHAAQTGLLQVAPGGTARARAVHHLDLWVDDVDRAEGEWGWLLAGCGWQREDGIRSWLHPDGTYVFMEHSPDQHGSHDRLRPGVNHVALTVASRERLDRLRAEAGERGWRELYADGYPHAGGPQHVALYLESSEGFEVEVVAGQAVASD